MNIEEKIIQSIHELPVNEKAEVLDLIEYLRNRVSRAELKEWSALSLSSAMRCMEDEDPPYSLADLKESFS